MRILALLLAATLQGGETPDQTIITLTDARIEATGVQVNVEREGAIWVIRIAPK